ncbi:hypothetical protein MPH_11988 [Macrophomina phaseolina MS6]|uniref:Uncharacterized protein n=1 Tax=Macrophomina phaseolina (strain MS6) TaxID=1126212 RepID=K2S2S9_MACPH|nr:hypothetical protein MPH_11988 [Macrophomina phaseolina MS6]
MIDSAALLGLFCNPRFGPSCSIQDIVRLSRGNKITCWSRQSGHYALYVSTLVFRCLFQRCQGTHELGDLWRSQKKKKKKQARLNASFMDDTSPLSKLSQVEKHHSHPALDRCSIIPWPLSFPIIRIALQLLLHAKISPFLASFTVPNMNHAAFGRCYHRQLGHCQAVTAING